MTRKINPIPKTSIEVSQEQINPLISKPTTVTELNRGTKNSFKDDKVQDISIGLQDIDEAILYYFENIIKPSVIQNGNQLIVPIIYGSPERWKAVKNDGFYRDKDMKIMVPLIMFRRETVEKNRDLGNKLDGNQVHLYQVFEKKYTQRNQYDRLSVLTNRIPQRELYATVIPDYLNLTYSCIVWTDYVEQSNKIIEAIEFASDSYWGNPNRFKFKVRIDSFSTTTLLEQGTDRSARTTFNINLSGYIIPNTINKYLSTDIRKYYSKCQIIFNTEIIEGHGLANTTDITTPINVIDYLIDNEGNNLIDSDGTFLIE